MTARYRPAPPLALTRPRLGAHGDVYGIDRPRIALLAAGIDAPEAALTPTFVALGEACGIYLIPWERWVLGQLLRRRPDGQWENPDLWLLVPRRNGKNVVLKVLEIGALFLLDDITRISHSAHLLTVAKDHLAELHRHMSNLGAEFFARHKIVLRTANDDPCITLEVNGVPKRLRAIARTNDGGRGGETDILVIDEALKLTSQHLAALAPLTLAAPNPLTLRTSSMAYEGGEVLNATRDQVLAGDVTAEDLAWLEWSAAPGSDVHDVGALATANPSLGWLFGLSRLARARQGFASDMAKFQVEHMGMLEEALAELPVITEEMWDPLARRVPFPDGIVTIGIDRSPKGTDTAVVAATVRQDGVAQVELIDNRSGDPGWAVDVVLQVSAQLYVQAVVIDGQSPAMVLVDPLRAAGFTVTITGLPDVVLACQGLLDKVNSRLLTHNGDIATAASVTSGLRRVTNTDTGAWAWRRATATSSITILVAMTLAVWALSSPKAKRATRERPPAAVGAGRESPKVEQRHRVLAW